MQRAGYDRDGSPLYAGCSVCPRPWFGHPDDAPAIADRDTPPPLSLSPRT